MKKIIITGANGQLGRAINHFYQNSKEFVCVNTDVAELNICDITAVLKFVEEVKPYAIINCAAHTGVDACETDVENAFKINAIGPRNLAIAASKNQAKIIHISTDYVFPGDGDRPYTEFDTPGPKGVYGASKLAGENFVKDFSKDYMIIRTAWLYGEGKNFVKTMLRLAETNEIVRVVGDQYGSPTSAKELARFIGYLLPTDNYGLFHGTCEGQCSWAEFATEIFAQAKKTTKVEAITTAEYPTPAVRPAYSVLENTMLKMTTDFQFADWKDAIAEYIEDGIL